ncbi:MAG: S41 family peptidase [Planctomycetota bacterium]|jgi:carboxyl-terminal processing protease
MRLRTLLVWVSPVILGSFLIGHLTARGMYARSSEAYWNATIAERVREIVGSEYVDEISDERGHELFFAAMEGYLKALDDYCTFYDPDERRAMEEETTGQFGGVGILIRSVEEGLLVVGLREGDPAAKAGVLLGDVIVTVDGEAAKGRTTDDLKTLIRGLPGSKVTLGVDRDGARLDLEMARSAIRIDSVLGVRIADEEHGIGYLRVSSFQENTGADARRALEWLREQGARSFVIDLRHNTGGVLEKGAVDLVDLFLDEGPIVRTRGRSMESVKTYEAKAETTVCATEPVVVLVDGGSASAAEVVAGAFQDRRRGILLGERTYGKFMVQSIHRLPQLDVALQLTTAKYFTPYGRWLQRSEKDRVRGGLLPDVVVDRSQQQTRQLLQEVFSRQHGMDMRVMEETKPGADPQLERALALLRDFAAVRGEEPK